MDYRRDDIRLGWSCDLKLLRSQFKQEEILMIRFG
jgi:hypothetical protein